MKIRARQSRANIFLTKIVLSFSNLCASLLVIFAVSSASGEVLRLEFSHEWAGRPVQFTALAEEGKPSVARLDYLISGLSLQRLDGSWLDGVSDWVAYISAGEGRTAAFADGVPAQDFKAIRFRVGVNAAMNGGDPNAIAPSSALHPDVNKLHWGWQGGYVFLALEGHYAMRGKPPGGYSYHLGNDANLMAVELPVALRGAQPNTVQITFDVAHILEGVDFSRDGASTHSRAGDALAVRLKTNVESAFRVRAVKGDAFQENVAMMVKTLIPAGTTARRMEVSQRLPRIALPADNPLTGEGVALGRRLFHDSRLSVNNTQSCESCHVQGSAFADPRKTSTGAEGQSGKRNAMALFNLAWQSEFFWDGRAKSLREQVLVPIQDAHEMNESLDRVVAKLSADAECAADFAKAFGGGGVTSERVAKALEQFLLTLVSQDSRFDLAVRKQAEMDESEKRGLQLFLTEFDPARGLRGADCFHCHGGTLFTDHQFHNNGLALAADDIGRMGVTKNPADRGKFRAPSLRNIAATAPYMHDGRFATLEEVVEHYSSGVQRSDTLDPNLAKHPEAGLSLTAEEKRDLVAFLKTLTDESFIHPTKPALAAQP